MRLPPPQIIGWLCLLKCGGTTKKQWRDLKGGNCRERELEVQGGTVTTSVYHKPCHAVWLFKQCYNIQSKKEEIITWKFCSLFSRENQHTHMGVAAELTLETHAQCVACGARPEVLVFCCVRWLHRPWSLSRLKSERRHTWLSQNHPCLWQVYERVQVDLLLHSQPPINKWEVPTGRSGDTDSGGNGACSLTLFSFSYCLPQTLVFSPSGAQMLAFTQRRSLGTFSCHKMGPAVISWPWVLGGWSPAARSPGGLLGSCCPRGGCGREGWPALGQTHPSAQTTGPIWFCVRLQEIGTELFTCLGILWLL